MHSVYVYCREDGYLSVLQHPEQGLAHSRRFRNNPAMNDCFGRGPKSPGAAQGSSQWLFTLKSAAQLLWLSGLSISL